MEYNKLDSQTVASIGGSLNMPPKNRPQHYFSFLSFSVKLFSLFLNCILFLFFLVIAKEFLYLFLSNVDKKRKDEKIALGTRLNTNLVVILASFLRVIIRRVII